MNWTVVTDGIKVPARPEGIWTLVFDYVRGPALLKIEAAGTWRYSPSSGCGPDGDLNTLVSAGNAILAEAPVGALLVKVGGSTAGVGDGVVHVAGRYSVVKRSIAALRTRAEVRVASAGQGAGQPLDTSRDGPLSGPGTILLS